MGKSSFLQTGVAQFEKDNGEPDIYSATYVCPFCKHVINVVQNISSGEIEVKSKCPHLNHFESVTGHTAIFEFVDKAERPADKVVAGIVDHVTRKKLFYRLFRTEEEAIQWAKHELRGWMEKGDKVVIEERSNENGRKWKEVMIQFPDGEIADYYAEVHNG